MQKEIAHPDLKTPIKKWWHGHYDHVFIALYPFFTVRPEDQDVASDLSYASIPNFEDIPDDFDDTVKRRGAPVTWQSARPSVTPEVCPIQLPPCSGFFHVPHSRSYTRTAHRYADFNPSMKISTTRLV